MMYREYTLQDIGHLSDIYQTYRTSSVFGTSDVRGILSQKVEALRDLMTPPGVPVTCPRTPVPVLISGPLSWETDVLVPHAGRDRSLRAGD